MHLYFNFKTILSIFLFNNNTAKIKSYNNENFNICF